MHNIIKIIFSRLLPSLLVVLMTAPLAADWGAASFYEGAHNQATRPHSIGLYDAASQKTYAVFGDDFTDPNIIVYDHAKGEWQDPVQIGGQFNDIDYHCAPKIIRDATGRVHVFVSRLNMAQYICPSLDQIDGEWLGREIFDSSGNLIEATYNMPVLADDGEMLVFYRLSNRSLNQPWMVIRSQDNGDTWGDPEPVIKHDPPRPDQLDTIYCVIDPAPATADLPERVIMAWTNAGPGIDGSGGYNGAHKDMFFAYYSLDDHQMYSADNTPLGDFVDNAEAEAHCKIYDSGPLGNDWATSHLFAVADTPEGKYTVGFVDRRDGHNAVICHWTGSEWTQQSVLEDSERDPGDLQNIGGNSLRFYMADNANMHIYESTDSGASWTLIDSVGAFYNAYAIEGGHHPSAAAIVRGPGADRWSLLGEPALPPYSPPPLEDRGITAPEGALFFDSFEDDTMDGWTVERGGWDVDVQDPRRGVRQAQGEGAASSRIVNGDATWTDYRVSCELEVVSVTPAIRDFSSVGLLARYTDYDNHYGFTYRAKPGEYLIYKRVNGAETILASLAAPFEMLAPHQWQAVLNGGNLEFWVDGEKILEAADSEISSGKIALLASKADTIFDDVTVLPPDLELSFLTTDLPVGELDTPYSAQLTAAGGLPPYQWQPAPSASLPPNLALDPGTGSLSGTPAIAGRFTFDIVLSDSAATTVTETVSLDVISPTSDIDDNGLRDAWEIQHFGSLDQNPAGNPDGDEADNLVEQTYMTDPNEPDTDGDGVIDGLEISLARDPTGIDRGTLDFQDAFERTTGPLASAPGGWSLENGDLAVLEAGTGTAGSTALKVAANSGETATLTQYLERKFDSVVWTELDARFTPFAVDSPPPATDAGATAALFLTQTGDVAVVNGSTWEIIDLEPGLDVALTHHYLIRQDFVAQTWKLWVNDQLLTPTPLAFAADQRVPNFVRLTHASQEPCLLDNLLIHRDAPTALPGLQDYSFWSETVSWGAANSAPSADTADSGLTNLEKYAFGLGHPVSGSHPYSPQLLPKPGSDNVWTFVFQRNRQAEDVRFLPQISEELTSWQNIALQEHQVHVSSVSEEIDRVELLLPVTADCGYFRLLLDIP